MKVISTAISASILFGSVDAILGGQPVPPGTRTYTTGLRETLNPRETFTFCGGTLISPSYVLTAASCEVVNARFVSVGANSSEGLEGDDLRVAKFVNHPQFNAKTLAYDFAILTLSGRSTYKPVKLPTASDIRSGMWATAMGWGITSDHMGSPKLLQLSQQIISNDACRKALNSTTIGMSHVCAGGEGGKSPCQGDTGGPFISLKGNSDSDDVLIGVISGGDGCGVQGSPSIYARVSSVLPWINKIINGK